MSHIVAYRAPVLANDKIGREEKSPIHVADVLRLVEKSGPGEVPMTSREKVPATNSVLRLGEKLGRREISAISRGEDPATKSSSKPGSRFDRADVPVGVDTVEHKAIAVRRDARAGVSSDRVESFAKMNSKRVRLGLRKFGEDPNSQSEMAEAGLSEDISRRSSEVLRQENRSGGKSQRTVINTKPGRDAVTRRHFTGIKRRRIRR